MFSCRSLLNHHRHTAARSFFTNGAAVSRNDPFKTLGLDHSATLTEIKVAYRKLCMLYHPDVGAQKDEAKFVRVQKAYEAVTAKDGRLGDNKEVQSEYSFKQWRVGDMIAQKRVDVAGVKAVRPTRPVGVSTAAALGFSGSAVGSSVRKGSVLGEGRGVSSSVGRGVNKWTEGVSVYKPWVKKEEKET
jgi:curved DNA-binding protein CbpA